MIPKSLLVAVDFSPCSEVAVKFALNIAPGFDAAIDFLFVDVWRAPDEHGIPPPEALPDGVPRPEEIDESLKQLRSRAKAVGVVATSTCIRSLAIAPAIETRAAELDADAIVMGTHGYQGMRRFILGSSIEEVLRSTSRSLFIVPQAFDASTDGKRVLVPIDLSGSTGEQILHATEIASVLDLDVSLLYVIQPLPLIGGLTGLGTMGDLAPSLDRQVEREVGRLAREISKALSRQAKPLIRRGSAAKEIVMEADENSASLIVMARHGLSAVDRFFLGSVTERVARTSSTPMLVLTTTNDRKE